MAKIKPLLPSLREKKRYVAFEVISNANISFKAISKAIWNSLLGLTGELGAAKAGTWLLNDKYRQNKGLIKVNHKQVDAVKAALALIKQIEGSNVIVHSTGASGILKKAEKRYL